MDCISDHERAGAGACFAGECRITPSEALQQGHHVYSAVMIEKARKEEVNYYKRSQAILTLVTLDNIDHNENG